MSAHDDPPSKHKDKKHDQAGENGQPGGEALSAMGATPCAGGFAFTFPCRNVDLASFLPFSDIGGGTGNDVWGWTDPLTNREYALMGRSTGTSFVDISDPERPLYLGNLPTHTVASSWRGIKVFGNYAFIVSEASGHGMQIFDLTQLRNVTAPVTFSETTHYDGFSNAHTLAINESTGFAYAAGTNTCAGGLHMVDIRNPTAPTPAGCVSGDGYSHETQCVLYDGPSGTHVGRELCFSSNEDTLTVTDVTDKGAPLQLSRTGYANSGYAHQGWLTEDHRYFLMDDELDEQQLSSNTRTIIWDVSDVTAPFVSGVYVGPSTAIDHNLYIRGQLAYEANYRSGLRIVDISNVATASLSEVAYFDIYPVDDAQGYNGAWSNYPFFPSGVVIVSGIEQGLFVLRPTVPSATQANLSVTIADAPDPVSVGQNISYTIGVSNSGLASATDVTLNTTLSPGVSFISASPSGGTCSGSSTVTCALGSLANGSSASVTIVVRAEQAGTVDVTSNVSASQSDPSLANNSATATTTVAGNVLPAVSLTSPSAGTIYTAPASIALTASASDSDGSIDRVDFYANGSLIGTDTTSPYEFTWGGVSAGAYSLTARAVDNVGATTESAVVSVTVEDPQNTMHVGDLDGSAQSIKRQIWKAAVTITVHDAADGRVAAATVSGQWTGGYSGIASCTTDAAGQCSLSTGNINVKKTSASFTVTGVSHTTFTYRSADNHDVDGGSNGTTITVIKP